MEDIIDANYRHAKKVCKYFEIKNLGEYHDLYVQIDTLLLGDIIEIRVLFIFAPILPKRMKT